MNREVIITQFVLLLIMPYFSLSQILVADINQKSESASSNPNNLYGIGYRMIFFARTQCYGTQLFSTDGTAEGTHFLKEVQAGPNPAIRHYVQYDDKVYFKADGEKDDQLIWSTDGTSEGTIQIANLGEALGFETKRISITNLVRLDNEIIVKALSRDLVGLHLVKLNLETQKAQIIKTINPHGGSLSSVEKLFKVNGVVIFKGDDLTNNKELWRTDGTKDGTYLVKNIRPQENSSADHLISMRKHDQYLFFIADDGTTGVWQSDGSEENTIKLTPDEHSVRNYFIENGNLYYITSGSLMFVLRGDFINAEPEQIFFEQNQELLSVTWIIEINDHILVYCNTNNNGNDLWSYSLDSNKWSFLEIYPGTQNANMSYRLPYAIKHDGYFYFTASNDSKGRELWRTDGTTNNTAIIRDIKEGPEGSNPSYFHTWKDYIYFQAESEKGNELYKYSPNDFDNDGYLPPDDIDNFDADVSIEIPNDPDPCKLTSNDYLSSVNYSRIQLAPNPTQNYMTINIDTKKPFVITIYNLHGDLMLRKSNIRDGHELNLQALTAGVYILNLSSVKQRLILNEKIVVCH